MILICVIAYFGGLLTIFAPCVLPVIPFIFARSDQPFRRSGLPILLGMAFTFTALASLAAIGGAWLIRFNQYGRYCAMALLFLLGLALIYPAFSDCLMRPFVRLGGHLQERANQKNSIKSALLLGIAVGFLWAPCAGPVLGLLLTGAALNGANLYSAFLLLIFAAGAATSLGLALIAGSRLLHFMKRGLGAEEWIRRALGITVVTGVILIALGWDTRFLSQWSFINTSNIEHHLVQKIEKLIQAPSLNNIKEGASMPSLASAGLWLNSPPLTNEMLQGKVVLIDFWTYSCINCLRTLPYLKAWHEKYHDQGLVIIGIHTPEFAFEQNPKNLEKAIHDLGLKYPIAMDNQYKLWEAFQNQYWPAHYLVDSHGIIRHHSFGEGGYAETEEEILKLLQETPEGKMLPSHPYIKTLETGVTAPTDSIETSPETYIGYKRQMNFSSPESINKNNIQKYSTPKKLPLHHWALNGEWNIGHENALLQAPNGSILYHFQGRDLHLVLGSTHNTPIHFRVTLEGKPPGADHGADTDAEGYGVIQEQRLYQLIRQHDNSTSRFFRIEFLDAEAMAFAFTFG